MTNEPRLAVEQVLFPSSTEQKWWALCGKLGVLGSDGRGIRADVRLDALGFTPLRVSHLSADEPAGVATFVGIVSEPDGGARHIAMAGVVFASGPICAPEPSPDAPVELGWEPEIGFRYCEFAPPREDGWWVAEGTVGYVKLGSRSALPEAKFGFGEPPWADA